MPKEFERPDYPKILTKANWDKKKSLLAKAAGETGVGAAMDTAQAAYDAVDWDKLKGCNDPPSANSFHQSCLEGRARRRDEGSQWQPRQILQVAV
ncbi:MAG: hypothetical protein ACREFY_11705 [Acetobacteraceae bacterium]